jgi:hypothetical protein
MKAEIIILIINTIILGINIWVIRKSPVDAVKIGRELNEEKQKDDAKRELFLQLFENRGHPTNYQFVRNLNRIDVVYNDSPLVLEAWHKYFEALHQQNAVNQEKTWELLRTQLLQTMSDILGYKKMGSSELMQYYYPEGHQRQSVDEWELWTERKNYYKNSNQMILKVLENLNLEDGTQEQQDA